MTDKTNISVGYQNGKRVMYFSGAPIPEQDAAQSYAMLRDAAAAAGADIADPHRVLTAGLEARRDALSSRAQNSRQVANFFRPSFSMQMQREYDVWFAYHYVGLGAADHIRQQQIVEDSAKRRSSIIFERLAGETEAEARAVEDAIRHLKR